MGVAGIRGITVIRCTTVFGYTASIECIGDIGVEQVFCIQKVLDA